MSDRPQSERDLTPLLERRFGVRAAGSTPAREVVAGLVTFATLSYILFVQPAVLGARGCIRPTV